jgi:hypothetical protein
MSAFPIDIAPSVADVAALLRARTKDVNGEEIGTFNDDTRPTSAQVLTLIERPSPTFRPAWARRRRRASPPRAVQRPRC